MVPLLFPPVSAMMKKVKNVWKCFYHAAKSFLYPACRLPERSSGLPCACRRYAGCGGNACRRHAAAKRTGGRRACAGRTCRKEAGASEEDAPSGLAALFDDFRAEYNLTEQNFAVSYYDTVTQESYDWNETHMMVAASTFKLPLNLYYYEMENAGEIASDALMTQGGATLDLCHYLSIVESNNEISHALSHRIGTFPEYKEAMRKYFTMTDDEIDPNNTIRTTTTARA